MSWMDSTKIPPKYHHVKVIVGRNLVEIRRFHQNWWKKAYSTKLSGRVFVKSTDFVKSAGVCFTTAYTLQQKIIKPVKNQADMVLLVSLKLGLDKNCPMLNVYDVVAPVRRMIRYN